MAVKMRLARHGAKKRPFYHIVVADARMPRDGRYIERIGSYNPMVPKDHAQRLVVKEDRVKHWLSTGAQPTDRVARFLANLGLAPKIEYRESPKRSLPKAKAQERLKEKEDAKLKAIEEAKAAKEAAKAAAEAPAPAAEEAAAE
ncbi:MAG: 30S ribosomal protein S16 [Alphaproteobacteria bacterium]|nr:30S ribosomal protein S16 [Alphaproteobacteria bacterium]